MVCRSSALELVVADARNVLNFERPIAVMLLGILGYVADLDEARSIVRRIMAAVPSGSYLLLRDNTDLDAAARDAADDHAESGVEPYHLRTVDELLSLFDGLELVEPGLVQVAMWRPDQADIGAEQATTDHAGLARKP